MKRLNRWMCAACCLCLLLSAGPAHAAFSQGLERLDAWERAGGRIEAEPFRRRRCSPWAKRACPRCARSWTV